MIKAVEWTYSYMHVRFYIEYMIDIMKRLCLHKLNHIRVMFNTVVILCYITYNIYIWYAHIIHKIMVGKIFNYNIGIISSGVNDFLVCIAKNSVMLRDVLYS